MYLDNQFDHTSLQSCHSFAASTTQEPLWEQRVWLEFAKEFCSTHATTQIQHMAWWFLEVDKSDRITEELAKSIMEWFTKQRIYLFLREKRNCLDSQLEDGTIVEERIRSLSVIWMNLMAMLVKEILLPWLPLSPNCRWWGRNIVSLLWSSWCAGKCEWELAEETH